MSNPTYGTGTPGADDPYTSTDPYATNVPYEPTDPNAPATGGYVATSGTVSYTPIEETGFDDSPSTKDVAKDEAANVKDTAVGAGKQVASTAKDEAANVAGEAKQQAKSLVSTATTQLKDQASTQQSRLASTLRGYTDQLQGLGQGQPLEAGPLNDLVQRAASRGSDFVSSLENREPADLLDDVRRFARQRPVVFLALCGLAGVVAGRITRGAVAANTSVDSPKPSGSAGTSYSPSTTTDYASTTYATSEPAYSATGGTYGAYTDAPAGGYSTEPGYTADPTSVGYADRGDPIR